MLAALQGCSMEEVFRGARIGERVTFRTEMGYNNGTPTKTIYSGTGEYVGETLVRERIDWVSGDVIRIWSDKAHVRDGSTNWADYLVTPTTNTGANSYATVSNKGANGLVWGEGTHEFYSLYPSPDSGENSSTFSGKEVSATIPAVQTYTVQGDRLMPDMDYAYMFAALKTEASSSIILSFKPMFTAFEFTIDSADDASMTLTSFEMVSASSPLSGTFTASLSASTNGPASSASYRIEESTGSVKLQFTGGLTIRKGQPKCFTVFALPQDLSDVSIRFTNSKNEVKSLDLKLADGTPVVFNACKKYRITSLGIPGTWTYTVDQIPSITLSTSAEKVYGGDREITVGSWRKRGTTTEPFPWRAQAEVDGSWVEAGDPQWPDWLTLSAYSGEGDSDLVTVHISPNEVLKEPPTGLGAGIAAILSSMPEKGTESAPYDLSRYDIYGQQNTSGRSTTANCYVIDAPGWYMFPLVYGNAIKNGTTNTGAYRPGVSAPLALSNFIGADGNTITSPYILQDGGLSLSGMYDACIIWEDVMPGYNIIDTESVEVVEAPSGAALNCLYIRFRIDREEIKPGNAVIALRDKGNGNKILWSWHIWLVPSGATEMQTTSVVFRPTATTTDRINLMNVNLGWAPPISYAALKTTVRSVRLRFIQNEPSTFNRSVTVTQQAYSGTVYEGSEYSATFYQWGRKDPFLPARGFVEGNANVNKSSSSPAGYTISSGTSNTPISNLNGDIMEYYCKATQNPYIMYRNDNLAGGLNAWDADNTAYQSDSPVVKTIYDPCPPGFCVPRFRAFTGFTANGINTVNSSEIYGDYVAADPAAGRPCGWMFTTSGTNANKTFFFAFAGMRSYVGRLSSVAERGYYWTAGRYEKNDPNYHYAESGYFTRGRVDPLYNIPSAHAICIRPMKE